MKLFVFTPLLVVFCIGVALDQLIATTTQAPENDSNKLADKFINKEKTIDINTNCATSSQDQRTFNLCLEYKVNQLRQQVQTMSTLSAKNINGKSCVPMDFIYTQYPGQSSPDVLWPDSQWTEVTQNYSGLFFRAEGKDSENFGKIQTSNQNNITAISIETVTYESWTGNGTTQVLNYPDLEGKWVGNGAPIKYMIFNTSKAEIRPINTAIKIWKRTN